MRLDTIFALSSGAPPAAIAIVRISGQRADDALSAITDPPLPRARYATLRQLKWRGQLLDSALVLRFPGPKSATGEGLVELHLHGGRATVATVLQALGEQPGLRSAEPGEFTRRAFENGRIDLAQAEGLSDLLRAQTESQRRAALAMAQGGLSRFVECLRRDLLQASARVEAAIDFDDEDDVVLWSERNPDLSALAQSLRDLLSNSPGEALHGGVRVAIGGPPNAGKSSLINALTARDAAIVSPIAGTTRDVIEVPIQFGGLAFTIIDTAGLRDDPGDGIEAAGIERATIAMKAADIVVWIGEPTEAPKHENLLHVRTKSDLGGQRDDGRLAVSALTGAGIEKLMAAVCGAAREIVPRDDILATNQRQRSCLELVADEIEHAALASDLLIAAEHLRLARAAIDRLVGRTGIEDMLDALFARFCVGK